MHVLKFSNKYKLVPRAADGYKILRYYDISFKLLAYHFDKRRLWDRDQWRLDGVLQKHLGFYRFKYILVINLTIYHA